MVHTRYLYCPPTTYAYRVVSCRDSAVAFPLPGSDWPPRTTLAELTTVSAAAAEPLAPTDSARLICALQKSPSRREYPPLTVDPAPSTHYSTRLPTHVVHHICRHSARALEHDRYIIDSEIYLEVVQHRADDRVDDGVSWSNFTWRS